MNMFSEEIEQQAIQRIQKFSKIAKSMGFKVCLGFSGGKDSQVPMTFVCVLVLNLKHISTILLKVVIH